MCVTSCDEYGRSNFAAGEELFVFVREKDSLHTVIPVARENSGLVVSLGYETLSLDPKQQPLNTYVLRQLKIRGLT